jgi:hypothetical protein
VGRFCSPACTAEARRGKPVEGFVTPESEKAQRIRANGFVNMRLRRGFFEKPKACMKCGKVGRLDSHHTDYSKPEEVYWLCRSCHMTAHHRADFLDGLAPFLASDQRAGVKS